MGEEVWLHLNKITDYAKASRSYSLMREAYGAAKMALKLGAITNEQFFDLNEKLVRNGINNPRSYDKETKL